MRRMDACSFAFSASMSLAISGSRSRSAICISVMPGVVASREPVGSSSLDTLRGSFERGPRMRRALSVLATACAVWLECSAARADNYDTLVTPSHSTEGADQVKLPSPDLDQPPPQRRSGFVVGLTVGAGLASSSGYPNNSNFIGDPSYYSASGTM